MTKEWAPTSITSFFLSYGTVSVTHSSRRPYRAALSLFERLVVKGVSHARDWNGEPRDSEREAAPSSPYGRGCYHFPHYIINIICLFRSLHLRFTERRGSVASRVKWTGPLSTHSPRALLRRSPRYMSEMRPLPSVDRSEWTVGWKGSIVPHSPLPMWFTPFTPHDGPEGSEGPGSEWERVNHMPLVSLSSHPFPFRSVSSGTLGSLTSLMMRESDTVVPLGSLCSPFVTGGRLTQSIESFILGWAPSFPTSLTASGSFPTVFHLQH